MGDYGEYARRMDFPDAARYVQALGGSQNFDMLRLLRHARQATPYHVDGNFKIPLSAPLLPTQEANSPAMSQGESRPIIPIRVNDTALNVVIDSGAGFDIPSTSKAAQTLTGIKGVQANSTALSGNVAQDLFSIVDKVNIAHLAWRNLFATVSPRINSGKAGSDDLGLLGFDFLLRFDAVEIDFRRGWLELNPPVRQGSNCRPMELVLNAERLIEGLATTVTIGERELKVRIDTGANLDLFLHAPELVAVEKFQPIPGKWVVDASGTAVPMESATVNASFGTHQAQHTAIKSSRQHGYFSATAGAQFFGGRIIRFDFKRQIFCDD